MHILTTISSKACARNFAKHFLKPLRSFKILIIEKFYHGTLYTEAMKVFVKIATINAKDLAYGVQTGVACKNGKSLCNTQTPIDAQRLVLSIFAKNS